MPAIKQECADCRGTGLYQGFCEGQGEAVVCAGCRGRGWVHHTYKEFICRKHRKGVKTIRVSQGSFLATGVGGAGKSMTYAEFETKYPEEGVTRHLEDGDYPMHPGKLKHIWLAFDLVNGSPHDWEGKGYCWWFRTRRAAREHAKDQNANPRHAPLSEVRRYAVLKLELV